jgi:glutamine cyclotransferase
MSDAYFGEGLTRMGNKLYQITWLTNEAFIYSIPDLTLVGGTSSSCGQSVGVLLLSPSCHA